jgi:hypothetical protein
MILFIGHPIELKFESIACNFFTFLSDIERKTFVIQPVILLAQTDGQTIRQF